MEERKIINIDIFGDLFVGEIENKIKRFGLLQGTIKMIRLRQVNRSLEARVSITDLGLAHPYVQSESLFNVEKNFTDAYPKEFIKFLEYLNKKYGYEIKIREAPIRLLEGNTPV